jgi:hypothetical protein
MPFYHFAIQGNGSRSEELGGMELADDGEALAFGRRVAREGHAEDYTGRTLDITEGDRNIGSIPLEKRGNKKR